jgi:hypothetical protein
VFIFFRNRPEYPLVANGVFLATVAVMLSSVFLGIRVSMHVIDPAQRRQLMSAYLGDLIGMILVPLTIVGMSDPTTPEEGFVIYAVWFIVVGFSYFSSPPSRAFYTSSVASVSCRRSSLRSFPATCRWSPDRS